MRANPLGLWLASFAYVLLCEVRRIGLAHTQFAQAACGAIRLKLLEIAGQVRVSARHRMRPRLRPSLRPGMAPGRRAPRPRRRRDADKIAAIRPTAHEETRNIPSQSAQTAPQEPLSSHRNNTLIVGSRAIEALSEKCGLVHSAVIEGGTDDFK